MTLIDLLEPLFQLVCRIQQEAGFRRNRSGIEQSPQRLLEWRKRMDEELKRVDSAAEKERLGQQWRLVKDSVVAFVDVVGVKLGGQSWSPFSRDAGSCAHIASFIRNVESELRASDSDAPQRLDVYYHCLALGGYAVAFAKADFPDTYEKLQEAVARLDRSEAKYLCPRRTKFRHFAKRSSRRQRDISSRRL